MIWVKVTLLKFDQRASETFDGDLFIRRKGKADSKTIRIGHVKQKYRRHETYW